MKLKLILPILLSLGACRQHKVTDTIESHYTCEAMNIDGHMSEDAWASATPYSLDTYFNVSDDQDKQKSSVRCLWNNDTLFFHFTCEDKYITARETQRDGAPFLDDCAEVFITPSAKDASMHFCFEVNILKAINDVVFIDNLLNEGPGVIKGYNPDIAVGVTINGSINNNSDIDQGWTMEMAIPVLAFNRVSEFYPINEGTQWRFLAIRQDRKIIDSEERISSVNFTMDNSPGMDVHQSQYFGIIQFVK